MNKYIMCMIVGLFLGTFIFCLSSCKKKCQDEDEMVNLGASIFGEALDCYNPTELKPYVKEKIRELKICDPTLKNNLDTPVKICTHIVDDIIDNGLDSIPKEADCSGGVAVDVTRSDAIEFCEAYFK